jgi:hypothetical protein
MKGKLVKTESTYHLVVNDKIIASVGDSDGKLKKLSNQNCDEIFGIINVDDLADQNAKKDLFNGGYDGLINSHQQMLIEVSYINGFKKAMELQKDKLFSEEIIEDAFKGLRDCIQDQDIAEFYINLAKTIFCEIQPKEIEVNIEMDDINKDNLSSFKGKPKLDENGCLILKNINEN